MVDRSNGPVRTPETPLELPLASLPSGHPCERCGECCRYLAIEIDAPTTPTDYDHIYWYLTHRDVSVYVDWEGDWFVEFVTVCEHLTQGATCGIYRDRPEICSDFSWNECERATGESASKFHFRTPDEFWSWMAERRPRAFAKLQARRAKVRMEREKAATEVEAPPATTRD
ncbi:MAG: YkgJ family cysteine cluster protein [Myxococcota bacterium]